MVILSEELLAERWFCSVSRIQRWRSEKIGPPYLKVMGRILYRQYYRQHILLTALRRSVFIYKLHAVNNASLPAKLPAI